MKTKMRMLVAVSCCLLATLCAANVCVAALSVQQTKTNHIEVSEPRPGYYATIDDTGTLSLFWSKMEPRIGFSVSDYAADDESSTGTICYVYKGYDTATYTDYTGSNPVPWSEQRTLISAVDVIGDVKVKSCSYLFSRLGRTAANRIDVSVDLKGLDTSQVTNFSNMFKYNYASSIDASVLDVSSAKDMSQMFRFCAFLTELSLDGWADETGTANVTTFAGTFDSCSRLADLDATWLNTSSATTMNKMFYQCASWEGQGIAEMDVSQVTDMSAAFSGCSSLGIANNETGLKELDISAWVGSPTKIDHMFYGCSSLERIWSRPSESAAWLPVISSDEDATGTFSLCGALVGEGTDGTRWIVSDVEGWDNTGSQDSPIPSALSGYYACVGSAQQRGYFSAKSADEDASSTNAGQAINAMQVSDQINDDESSEKAGQGPVDSSDSASGSGQEGQDARNASLKEGDETSTENEAKAGGDDNE